MTYDYESCERCGMGRVTTADSAPWEHVCPEPYSKAVAEALLSTILAYGIVIHPRMKARIKLGLEQ